MIILAGDLNGDPKHHFLLCNFEFIFVFFVDIFWVECIPGILIILIYFLGAFYSVMGAMDLSVSLLLSGCQPLYII